MKRGFGLVAFLALLLAPVVFAQESVLDVFLGTSEESLVLIRIMYSLLLFVLIFKVSKESLFKEKQNERLGLGFSLLFALLVMRFTPDAWVSSFGWVIAVLAPLMVLYALTGIFFKTKEGEVPWGRLLLTLVAGFLLFIALGSSPGFSFGIGNAPYVGGSLDEFFSDVHYLVFYNLSGWIVGFIVVLGIAFLLMALGRLPALGGTGAGAGWSGFLQMLVVALLVAGLIALLGTGILGIPLEGLGALLLTGGKWLLLALAVGLILYFLYRVRAWRSIGYLGSFMENNWRWVLPFIAALVLGVLLYFFWPVLIGFWPWILGLLILGLIIWLFARRRGAGGGGGRFGGRTLFVELQTPTQRIRWNAAGAARTIGAPAGLAPGSVTPMTFTAYRGRFFWSASRLQNAAFTFAVNNGVVAPPNGNTNNRGELTINYTAPGAVGNAVLRVQVAHADIDPLSVVPDYPIQIGVVGGALTVVIPPIAAINVGQTADIIVNIVDAAGAGVNGATVDILFPTSPGVGPFNGTTVGGAAGTPGTLTVRTPPFGTAATYNFVVNVRAAGYPNPGPVNGAIVVNNPVRDDLEVFNVTATPAGPVRVGQRTNITFNVRNRRTGAAFDTAATVINPNAGIVQPVRRGAGLYAGSFTPTAAQIGMNNFVIQATDPRGAMNDGVDYIDIDVEPIPTLNVGITPPASPMRAATTDNITVAVTDPTGVPVVASVVILLGGAAFATGSSTGGTYTVAFTPPRDGLYSFTVRVRAPGYQDPPDQSFTVPVLPLGQLTVTVNTATPRIVIGDTADIDVYIVDASTGAPVAGTVTFTPNIGLAPPTGPAAGGNFRTQFTPRTAGRYTFTVNVTAPGYAAPRPPATITIEVTRPPGMNVTVTWVPEPANRYLMLNFQILDSVTGNPIQDAEILITDGYANPVNVNGSRVRTERTGQLAAPLRVDIGGRIIPTGTQERHPMTFEVSHGSYPTKSNSTPIMFTFMPPRTRLGGPQTANF